MCICVYAYMSMNSVQCIVHEYSMYVGKSCNNMINIMDIIQKMYTK